MLSETDPLAMSPRDSREGDGLIEFAPKKTVDYGAGSRRLLAGRRNHANLIHSPQAPRQGLSIPFKNGTQLSFKGDPVNSPLQSTDMGGGIKSLQSLANSDNRVDESLAMQLAGRQGSFPGAINDHGMSTKDTAQDQSTGINNSGSMDQIAD